MVYPQCAMIDPKLKAIGKSVVQLYSLIRKELQDVPVIKKKKRKAKHSTMDLICTYLCKND